jgi:(S)-ureidoglycine aminohydrolase
MKRLLLAIAASGALTGAVSAQIAPVKARVYRWNDLRAVNAGGGRVDRVILTGSTLDLDSLEVRAVTLAPTAGTDSGDVHHGTETFMMVKEGKLWVTLNGVSRPLGAGSVAVAMPGDRLILSNIGGTPATYYLFSYRSRAPIDLTRGRQAGGSFMVDFSELPAKRSSVGMRRDVVNRPTAMFRRFESHWSSVNEGLRNHATHTHRADEFMMMTGGEVEMLIGERHPHATTGDVVFLGSMIPHSLANTGKGPAQYLVIQGE